MRQLMLDLSRREAFGRADFFAADSNAAALTWIDRWPDWPGPVLTLYGPAGAGKTHLAHLWCERAGARLIAGDTLDDCVVSTLAEAGERRIALDDADRAAESALLHLFNMCVEEGGTLLLTTRQRPGSWRPNLADLGSRLRGALAAGIGEPGDSLLGAVLAKHFADRQVRVPSEVIVHLASRIERSFTAAAEIAAALDHAAFSSGGAITVSLARRVLAQRADQRLPPGSEPGVT